MKKSSATCPGKLIISGEHAVVYGAPAIAVALNRSMTTTVSARSLGSVLMNLPSLSYTKTASIEKLRRLKRRLKASHNKFLAGEYGVSDVLKKPFELAQFTLINALEHAGSHLLSLNVETQSNLLTGCGMGSSAALAVTITGAVVHYHGLEVSDEEFLELACIAEDMQHGVTSGLDIQTCFYGGAIYSHGKHCEQVHFPDLPICFINTGQPKDSTGAVVSHVKQHFASSDIWEAFSQLCREFKYCLQQQSFSANDFCRLIEENQKLLEDIQVVPQRVKSLIADLKQSGHSAKICGAGSVEGDSAGIVMVYVHDRQVIDVIADKYQCDVFDFAIDRQGLRYD